MGSGIGGGGAGGVTVLPPHIAPVVAHWPSAVPFRWTTTPMLALSRSIVKGHSVQTTFTVSFGEQP